MAADLRNTGVTVNLLLRGGAAGTRLVAGLARFRDGS
jgi:hypothetical protein